MQLKHGGGNGGTNNRVLIIDDEPDVVEIFKAGLQNFGYDVDAFTDPLQALENYKQDYYGRIITDIRMPSMTGFELARQIWAKDPGAQICFFSAFEIFDNVGLKVIQNLNSYCFIRKPITPHMLAKHVQGHSRKEIHA